MPRHRLAPDDRRALILEAGLRVFSRSPGQEASVQEVAREAGMSPGLLYHYFPGKQALFEATYEHLAERFIQAFSMRADTSPWTLIDQALDTYLHYAQRFPGVILLLLRPALQGQGTVWRLNAALNERLARLIAQGFGIPASDARRRTAIRAWLAFVDQAVLDMLEHRKPSRRAVRELCVSVLRAALAPTEAAP